jgi:predicted 2-oxoglutarate/Fe(II)-dependent dioxygenase YbiX
VLNLKNELLDYSLTIKKAMKKPLINLINEEIYHNVDEWEMGTVKKGEDRNIRSVKLRGFEEGDIGNSISKRIIYNELKKFTSTINDEYKKNVSGFYFSEKNYFQFLYYDKLMNGHYDYHTDHFLQNPRVLTILVGLNSTDEYEGGELLVGNQKEGVKLGEGDLVLFPSNFMYPHKVNQVTKGARKVLIIWTQ